MIEVLEVKKAVVVAWDTNVVVGKHVSVSAAKPNGAVVVEKKNVLNKGKVVLTFPAGYSGKCFVVARGSAEGEEEGTIEV